MAPRKRYQVPRNRGNIFETYENLLRFSYWDTPCRIDPVSCEPREIEHVILDADETMWDTDKGELATSCRAPFKKIAPDALLANCGNKYQTTIRLKPGLLRTLENLEQRNIGVSVASNNQPGSVQNILDAFGIRDKFERVKCGWEAKERQVINIARETNTPPEKIIFVDDSPQNANLVHYYTDSMALVMGLDIVSPEEILHFIKESDIG